MAFATVSTLADDVNAFGDVASSFCLLGVLGKSDILSEILNAFLIDVDTTIRLPTSSSTGESG